MPESMSGLTSDGKIGYFLVGQAELLLAQEAEVEARRRRWDSTALSSDIAKGDTSSEVVEVVDLDFPRNDNRQCAD